MCVLHREHIVVQTGCVLVHVHSLFGFEHRNSVIPLHITFFGAFDDFVTMVWLLPGKYSVGCASKTLYDISFGSKEFSGQQVCQNAVR